MRGITYSNTKTTLQNRIDALHVDFPLGYAYENDTHFVHFYGRATWFYVIADSLTVLEKKQGSLEDWVTTTFGAEDIKTVDLEVGNVIEGVWRPGLYFYEDTYNALKSSQVEMRLAEQSLRILLDKLDELFLYVEPDVLCLDTYSHKTRELLILACTEVENSWKHFLDRSGTIPANTKTFTTKDYVKVVEKLHLRDYQFKLRSYEHMPPVRPFQLWNNSSPTTSLSWYDAYNKTKHDRSQYFSSATLNNVINAVVASLVMHCVRFSPFPMFEEHNAFASIVSQHFLAELIDCDTKSFYLPFFKIPPNTREDLFIFSPRDHRWLVPFITQPLVLT